MIFFHTTFCDKIIFKKIFPMWYHILYNETSVYISLRKSYEPSYYCRGCYLTSNRICSSTHMLHGRCISCKRHLCSLAVEAVNLIRHTAWRPLSSFSDYQAALRTIRLGYPFNNRLVAKVGLRVLAQCRLHILVHARNVYLILFLIQK